MSGGGAWRGILVVAEVALGAWKRESRCFIGKAVTHAV